MKVGKGKDRKGTKADGLRFEWQWIPQYRHSGAPDDDNRRVPCRTCEAEVECAAGGFTFQAYYWNPHYRAEVDLDGHTLWSKGGFDGGFDTRLEAQQWAEAQLEKVCQTILREVYGVRPAATEE